MNSGAKSKWMEIVCNVQGAKSLKQVNRLGSSVCDLFERTKDGKTAKCLICKKVYMTSGNTNSLGDHLIKDIQPFYIVDDEGFRNFVKVLDPRYTLPSRTTLQNVQMQNIYAEMTVKLQTILVKVNQCAITMDCWPLRCS